MKDFFAGLNTTAGKIAATALLAVTLTGAAAAPAMAEQVVGNTNDNSVGTVDNSLNGNKVKVCVPVNAAVSVVGDAKAVQNPDCDKETPKPSPSTKPVSKDEELPVTGAPAGIIAGAAALMVAGGIFAVRAARRRGRHAGAAA